MVITVNLVVMLFGLSMAGLAVWLLVSEHIYLSSSFEDFSLVTCAALSVGLLMALLAFMACCGAITSSRCFLGMFVISLVAMMGGQVAVALLLYFKVSNQVSKLRPSPIATMHGPLLYGLILVLLFVFNPCKYLSLQPHRALGNIVRITLIISFLLDMLSFMSK